MSEQSAISWTEATWNPTTGCDRVSPGCANCYALAMAKRLKAAGNPRYQKDGGPASGPGFGLTVHPDLLDLPLRWKKPRLVFVDSMSDLFHEDVPDVFIDRVFGTMLSARRHTFQVLTKRPERMRAILTNSHFRERVAGGGTWPLPNVHLGVSVENQHWADERIPVLLDTPAAVRFLSCEPLLGPLDLRKWLRDPCGHPKEFHHRERGCLFVYEDGRRCDCQAGARISWVIVGGESGPGRAERKLVERCWHCCDRHRMECEEGRNDQAHHHWPDGPPASTAMKLLALAERLGEELSELWAGHWCPKPQALERVRSLRDQCVAAGIPFFFKQWGGPHPTSGGRLLDGREWRQMPE